MATHPVPAPRQLQVRFPLISAGFASCTDPARLSHFLRLLGFELHEASGIEDIESLLAAHRKTTLLVYSPRGSRLIADVFEILQRIHRAPPLIVVSDQIDTGQYHELMGLGVADYFAESDDSEYIARSVEWIAKTRSA